MKKLGILAAAAALTASSLFADGIQINKYLNLSGFVDMSYTNVDNDTALNGMVDTASFNMDQAELDFTINAGEGLTARIDLESTIANGAGKDYTNVEQARLDYAFGDWTLTLGKFDTFIGLEALEPTGRYQKSGSLLFDLEPTQHTGMSLGYDNGFFNGALALVNSLAINNPNVGDEVAYALHAGVTPNKAWSVNLNYGISDDAASVASPAFQKTAETTLLTFDVMWENFGWTVGAEYIDTEFEEITSAISGTKTTDTDGYSLMVNYAFSERMALTGRFSTTDSSVNGTVGSTEKDEFSISPSYCFTKNWSGLLEYRKDTTSVTATPDVDTTTIALETTFTF